MKNKPVAKKKPAAKKKRAAKSKSEVARARYESEKNSFGLSPAQERAAVAFFQLGKVGEAARRSGIGQTTIRRWLVEVPAFMARVEQLQAEARRKAVAEATDVLLQWTRMGFFDIRELYDEQGRMLEPHMLPEHVARTIQSIEVQVLYNGARGEDRRAMGEIQKIKFADRHPALTNLAKHLGLLSDGGAEDGATAFLRELNEVMARAEGQPLKPRS